MSFHHARMLQRYGLGRPGDMYSHVAPNPIFVPLFTAAFSGLGLSVGATAVAASIGSAIAVTAITKGVHII